jgi:carbamoyl-phosphate synthase small subunit
VEKEKCYPTAIIAKEISKIPLKNSNKELFDTFFNKNNVVGIENIDTRMITRVIAKGNKSAIITRSNSVKDNFLNSAKKIDNYDNKELISKVSTKKEYTLGDGKKHIGVLDFGVEQSLLQLLTSLGYKVTVFPYNSDDKSLLSKKLDLLILSNGPGNPNLSEELVSTTKKLIGKIPIIGISFGSAIISLALGFKVIKLKVGHFSDGQTIINQQTKNIISTIQSHIYTTDEKSISNAEITYKNFNDNSIEGYRDPKNKIVAINFFPKNVSDPILNEIFEYV